MRWMRFLSPLSGIGQMNLPVAPMAHVSRVRASAPASASSGTANIAFAAGPSGRWNTNPGISAGPCSIQLTTGASSSQSPIGSMRASRLTRAGCSAATSQATMAPKEWPTSTTSRSVSCSNSSS